MEFTTFIRKPFIVNVVEITENNIAELAELVGTLEQKEDGSPYIRVNRKLVPNVFRVFPGYFMTKLGDNVRCYSKPVFEKQFARSTPEIESWVKFMGEGEISEDVV